MSTEDIRRHARRRSRHAAVSAGVAVAVTTVAAAGVVTQWDDIAGSPVGSPSVSASISRSPSPSTDPTGISPSPGGPQPTPDVSPAPVEEDLDGRVLLLTADLPAHFTADETGMRDFIQGPGYYRDFADWPFMRFELCPTFPPVTTHRIQEVRLLRSFLRDGSDETTAATHVASGQWVERHTNEANAVEAMADVREVIGRCGSYARITDVSGGFAGDDSVRFVERGGGRDANDHMYWTVIRVDRYVVYLRIASDANLADRLVQRLCAVYPVC
jgi:hypothetical protein